MDLILNVKINKKLEKDDVLVYDGKEWKNVSRKEFLAKMSQENETLREECKIMRDDLDYALKAIRELRGEDDEESN